MKMSSSYQLASKWFLRFYGIAEQVASWSKDPSTKVGAVIVRNRRILATGYNGVPGKIKDDDRLLDRDWKLKTVIHAEVNAIINAAKEGVSIHGAEIFVTMFPCSNCAAAIIQSGIKTVVIKSSEWPERWQNNFIHSKQLLEEAGVELIFL